MGRIEFISESLETCHEWENRKTVWRRPV